ncbi:GSCFA domain-containing protein [Salipiger mucosus]|uniref:GSCFA domain-containing protein n=1 Tax=Salipiger mucosus DSM 16094 TaxID=1123237 RepID=S9QLR6_9RHOB|nr:GSCFA domain-containing protein [Salipiger mucosus]EPX82416.1 hypothetical protein Salmuc_03221 [Salipiger mucosus DSM 16094]
MSRETPYSDLPDHCFWSRSHRGKPASEVDPVVKGGFTLTPEMKIATAGSCFAQHIARHLKAQGYNYLVTERAHPIIAPEIAARFGYGTFTARFGNIYTVRQLLQLARRAYGAFRPAEDAWETEGGLIDPFRPNIQPEPFAGREDYDAARETHFAAVREMIESADVFVFTFGLTEAWTSAEDGAVFPLAPGVAGGTFDAERHVFHNFTVDEITADFTAFVELMRARNPEVKILMTVSPVPLIATAREDQSVIAATAYSKAVLRVATEQLSQSLPDCHYFPSYEVITGNHARGAYFGPDLREVERAGVDHVMRLFMRHYTEGEAPAAPKDGKDESSFQDRVEKALDLICDEEMIEKAVR